MRKNHSYANIEGVNLINELKHSVIGYKYIISGRELHQCDYKFNINPEYLKIRAIEQVKEQIAQSLKDKIVIEQYEDRDYNLVIEGRLELEAETIDKHALSKLSSQLSEVNRRNFIIEGKLINEQIKVGKQSRLITQQGFWLTVLSILSFQVIFFLAYLLILVGE